jgi:hypothetical protein
LILPGVFKDNTFIPKTNVAIKDGALGVLNIDDAAINEAAEAERELGIFEEFFAALNQIDEELPPKFDEIISQGMKFQEPDF